MAGRDIVQILVLRCPCCGYERETAEGDAEGLLCAHGHALEVVDSCGMTREQLGRED